jgi:hypothetical protein
MLALAAAAALFPASAWAQSSAAPASATAGYPTPRLAAATAPAVRSAGHGHRSLHAPAPVVQTPVIVQPQPVYRETIVGEPIITDRVIAPPAALPPGVVTPEFPPDFGYSPVVPFAPVPATVVPGPVGQPLAQVSPRLWQWEFFGEFLYWEVRGGDVAYAIPVDGTAIAAVQTGPAASVDSKFEPGFRVGVGYVLDGCSTLTGTYTFYRSTAEDDVTAPPGDVLRALTTFPGTLNAAADSLDASASFDIELHMVDLDYRWLLVDGDQFVLTALGGVRYADLMQEFRADYTVLGATTVTTDIDMIGFGPRLGLAFERGIGRQYFGYGRGVANLLIGQFEAEYLQTHAFLGNQAFASFEEDRIVPVLELELGLGWQSSNGRVVLSAGYIVSAWFNMLTTPAWIDAVQETSFPNASETLTFDGLVARAEVRF